MTGGCGVDMVLRAGGPVRVPFAVCCVSALVQRVSSDQENGAVAMSAESATAGFDGAFTPSACRLQLGGALDDPPTAGCPALDPARQMEGAQP